MKLSKLPGWIIASAVAIRGLASGQVLAGQVQVVLDGSGPVYAPAIKPADPGVSPTAGVTVTVSNGNNLSVGYDLIDQRSEATIMNGTVKGKRIIQKLGTAHAGRNYTLRLRCQEPPWNCTKCSAFGRVEWP
jgi:hypothetical protein